MWYRDDFFLTTFFFSKFMAKTHMYEERVPSRFGLPSNVLPIFVALWFHEVSEIKFCHLHSYNLFDFQVRLIEKVNCFGKIVTIVESNYLLNFYAWWEFKKRKWLYLITSKRLNKLGNFSSGELLCDGILEIFDMVVRSVRIVHFQR